MAQEKLVKRCDDVFLETHAISISGNCGFVEWTMGLKIMGKEFIYPGTTRLLFAENGLMGITLPEKDGGQGGSLMDAVLAIEQVALVCPRSADVVQSGSFGPLRTFAEYASDFQKEKYLSKLLRGEIVIALGMTEPNAGSAVTDLTTKAVEDGDGFRVSGSKVFTSNSPDADIFLVYVRYHEGINGIGSVLMD